MMTPTRKLQIRGAIRSGEYVDSTTHKTLPIPAGMRYYYARDLSAMPSGMREEAGRILREHPRSKWIIGPR